MAIFPPTRDAVGVLYTPGRNEQPNESFCVQWNGNWYCVHNGRYVDQRQNGNEIVINHCRLDKNGNPAWESRSFYINNNNSNYPTLVDIKITPDLSEKDKHNCKDFRHEYPNAISPGTCAGIAYGPASKKSNYKDMKNGRYLYWETKSKNPEAHCVIHRSEPLLYKVWYYHFIKPKSGVTPVLMAKIDNKIDVLRVYETPTAICPKSNCPLD